MSIKKTVMESSPEYPSSEEEMQIDLDVGSGKSSSGEEEVGDIEKDIPANSTNHNSDNWYSPSHPTDEVEEEEHLDKSNVETSSNTKMLKAADNKYNDNVNETNESHNRCVNSSFFEGNMVAFVIKEKFDENSRVIDKTLQAQNVCGEKSIHDDIKTLLDSSGEYSQSMPEERCQVSNCIQDFKSHPEIHEPFNLMNEKDCYNDDDETTERKLADQNKGKNNKVTSQNKGFQGEQKLDHFSDNRDNIDSKTEDVVEYIFNKESFVSLHDTEHSKKEDIVYFSSFLDARENSDDLLGVGNEPLSQEVCIKNKEKAIPFEIEYNGKDSELDVLKVSDEKAQLVHEPNTKLQSKQLCSVDQNIKNCKNNEEMCIQSEQSRKDHIYNVFDNPDNDEQIVRVVNSQACISNVDDSIDIMEANADFDDKDEISDYKHIEDKRGNHDDLRVTCFVKRILENDECRDVGDSRTVQAGSLEPYKYDSDEDVQIIEVQNSETEPVDMLIVDDDDEDIVSHAPKMPISELPRIPKKKRTVQKDGTDLRIVVREEGRDREDYEKRKKDIRRRESYHDRESLGRIDTDRRSDSDRHSDSGRRSESDRALRRRHHRSRSRSRDWRRSRKSRSRSRSHDRSQRRHHRSHDRCKSSEKERFSSHKKHRRDRSREHRHRRTHSHSHSPRHQEEQENWNKENHDDDRLELDSSDYEVQKEHSSRHRNSSKHDVSEKFSNKKKSCPWSPSDTHQRDPSETPPLARSPVNIVEERLHEDGTTEVKDNDKSQNNEKEKVEEQKDIDIHKSDSSTPEQDIPLPITDVPEPEQNEPFLPLVGSGERLPTPGSGEGLLPTPSRGRKELVYDPAHPTVEETERELAYGGSGSEPHAPTLPPPDLLGGPPPPRHLFHDASFIMSGDGGMLQPQHQAVSLPTVTFGPHRHLLVNPVLISRPQLGRNPFHSQLPAPPLPPRFRWQMSGPPNVIPLQNQFSQNLPPGSHVQPRGYPIQINGGFESISSDMPPPPPAGQFPVSLPSGIADVAPMPAPPAPPISMHLLPHSNSRPIYSSRPQDLSSKESSNIIGGYDKTLTELVTSQNILREFKESNFESLEQSEMIPESKQLHSVFKVPLPPGPPLKTDGKACTILVPPPPSEEDLPEDSTEVIDMDMSPLEDDCELELPTPPDLMEDFKDEKVKNSKPLANIDLKALSNAIKKLTSHAADDVPGSAVDLTNKEKFLKKMHLQERVVDEVKQAIRPFYSHKKISKEEYKEILRKAVPKVCHSKSGDINPQKIQQLVEAYVAKFKKRRSSKKDKLSSKDKVKANGERTKAVR